MEKSVAKQLKKQINKLRNPDELKVLKKKSRPTYMSKGPGDAGYKRVTS